MEIFRPETAFRPEMELFWPEIPFSDRKWHFRPEMEPFRPEMAFSNLKWYFPTGNDIFDRKWHFPTGNGVFRPEMTFFDRKWSIFDRKWSIFDRKYHFPAGNDIFDRKWSLFDRKWHFASVCSHDAVSLGPYLGASPPPPKKSQNEKKVFLNVSRYFKILWIRARFFSELAQKNASVCSHALFRFLRTTI